MPPDPLQKGDLLPQVDPEQSGCCPMGKIPISGENIPGAMPDSGMA
jgi:hypothetical protein